MSEHHEGGCRCGKVRFRVEGPPMVTMACHCRGCQRMTAGAFSASALYPAERFALTQGEDVLGGIKTHQDHRFCPDCLSWLFTRVAALNLVNIRSTLLDDPSGFAPFAETYVSAKLPWAQTGAVRSFAEFPTEGEYPALMAEHAAWRATS